MCGQIKERGQINVQADQPVGRSTRGVRGQINWWAAGGQINGVCAWADQLVGRSTGRVRGQSGVQGGRYLG